MREASKMIAGMDFNADFFKQFPAECIAGRFTAGQLTAGKLPKFLHGICARSVRDQNPAFCINQNAGCNLYLCRL